MRKLFSLFVALLATTTLFGQEYFSPISVTDGTAADWDALPAEYVASATHTEGCFYDGLKSVKVYCDDNYLNILVEVNLDVVTDREWAPFHIFLNADGSAATGGYGDLFADADTELMLETAIYADGAVQYNPAVFKWWGDVGGSGWLWTDPNGVADVTNGWGAIVPEGSLPIGNAQAIGGIGLVEIQLLKELIPAQWADEFTIGFDIQQSWTSCGILPNAADDEIGATVLANKLRVKVCQFLSQDRLHYFVTSHVEPYTVAVVGADADITTANIPETIELYGKTFAVTSIGGGAFQGCSSLTSIAIPNSITSIGDYAFRGCSSLTSITIPNSITEINSGIFAGCSSLTSITIPNSVTSIGESAFENCFSLNSITIPNSITSIEKLVFGSCDSLTSITIPNSVTSIGEQAFYGCNTLTSITIPNSVTSIGERAFAVCPTLTSITIPNSVTSIGERALSECYFLKTNFINNSLLNAEENNYWGATFVDQDINGLLIRNDTVIKCRRLASSITIPNTITRIEDVAFAYCGNLTFVSIPNSVTSVGDDIFLSCRSLTSIVWDITEWTNPKPKPRSPFPTSLTSLTLGHHVEQIPAYFCYEMKNLSMINIPNVTKSIGESAFYGCSSLTSITIPNSVTSIGENAFAGCSKLQDVYCYAVEPPTAYDSSFSQYNAFLYIPCENKKAYMLDEVFGNFKYIECISSDEVKTNDVVITPTTNDVTIIWPTEGNADSYTIVIKKDDEVFCTLTFNADGQLLNIAFAPGRDGNHPVQYAEQAGNGYRFTVTGLEESTHYTYNIDVRDAADKTIKSYTGEFTTESLTAVETITTNNANSHKIIRDNQLLILRDGKTYTIMGAEIH